MKNTRGMKISRSSAIAIILVAAVITVGITIALLGMVQSDRKEQELLMQSGINKIASWLPVTR